MAQKFKFLYITGSRQEILYTLSAYATQKKIVKTFGRIHLPALSRVIFSRFMQLQHRLINSFEKTKMHNYG